MKRLSPTGEERELRVVTGSRQPWQIVSELRQLSSVVLQARLRR